MKIGRIILLLLIPCVCVAGPRTIEPTVKTPTSFAIFIDRVSFEKTESQILAYRDVVERDGLATWVFVDDWRSPEQIKGHILELYSSRTMPLEGIVLVGDIPIPMIRDGQYLSSAFKMDQSRPWNRSSIPSDRYYDDFGLKFDFLRQDDENPLFFYYSLRPDSRHHISCDIYSARIKPLEGDSYDKYALLAGYLEKVVRVRAVENVLDHAFSFRGHGYYNNDIESWSSEQVALREQLPQLYRAGSTMRYYDFESRILMKPLLLEQMMLPGTDMMLCHHHGSSDMQLISKTPSVSDAPRSIENVKRYLRSKTVGVKDTEQKIADYMTWLDVPRSWFDLSDSTRLADSLYNIMMDIYVEDIMAVGPKPNFVMLDACFNGSFVSDQYVAGAYLCSGGNTVTVQANTVNTIQDKWPDRYIGLLGHGVRLGQWSRHVQYLETHLFGDPTYRFVNTADPTLDVNTLLASGVTDPSVWLPLTDHPSADVRCIALRKLYDNKYPGINSFLGNRFMETPYGVERLECYTLLKQTRNEEYFRILPLACRDSYELLRRLAVRNLGESGDDTLIPLIVRASLEDYIARRMTFNTSEGIHLFDPEKVKTEYILQYGNYGPFTGSKQPLEDILASIDRKQAGAEKDWEIIWDTGQTDRKRWQEIKFYQNYRYHRMVPRLIAFASDSSQDPYLRESAIEAMGWFRNSFMADDIVKACQALTSDPVPEVAKQARKTIARLRTYVN